MIKCCVTCLYLNFWYQLFYNKEKILRVENIPFRLKLTSLNNIVLNITDKCEQWRDVITREKLGCNDLLIFIRKYGDIIIYFGLVMLRNALGDPDNVPALLFFQLQEGIEYTKMELLHKCVSVQVDFVLEKLVFQGSFAWVSSCSFKAHLVIWIVFSDASNLVIVICSS